jgi:hypothetical protein
VDINLEAHSWQQQINGRPDVLARNFLIRLDLVDGLGSLILENGESNLQSSLPIVALVSNQKGALDFSINNMLSCCCKE